MTVRLITALLLLMLAFTCVAQAQEQAETSKKMSLFDGETLNGWEGKSDYWSVKDGAITGQTTADNPLKANTFILWKEGELEDFELTLKFRIVGGNSGIQYRSEHKGDFVVGGYQADIDSTNRYMGILYEERGRGILAERTQQVVIDEDGKKTVSDEPSCDEEKLLASLEKEGWNEYRIVVEGNHIQQFINGFKTMDLVDNQTEKAKSKGILALQLHQGPPMVVQFKDIYLTAK